VVERTVHGDLAATAQLSLSSTAVGSLPGSALAPRIAPAMVVQARTPPQSDESVREAPVRWLNGGKGNGERRLGLGSKHTGEGSIYRGVPSTCSQCGP
jgi:hypothetical protein